MVPHTVTILGVQVDKLTLRQAVERCQQFIAEGGPHRVVTPNAEFIMAARQDPVFRDLINGSDLRVADGAGVVLASKLLGDPVAERVAGADLIDALLRAEPYRVFILGAAPDSVAEAARRLPERIPGTVVVGYHDGYFQPEAAPQIVQQIRAAAPQILVVGMGSPKQESFLEQHLAETGAALGMGVGGVIDLWAGRQQRAPLWLRRLNLEWAYRVVKFGRYGRSLPPLLRFAWAVWRSRP